MVTSVAGDSLEEEITEDMEGWTEERMKVTGTSHRAERNEKGKFNHQPLPGYMAKANKIYLMMWLIFGKLAFF